MESTTGNAKTTEAEFIEASRTFLRDDYLPKLLQCVHAMSDDDLCWRPNEVSNSVGNLILHLCGNVRQWIVSSVGGVDFRRNRDAEFTERGPVPKAELIASLTRALGEVDSVLATLDAGRILQRVKVQTYDVSFLQAVYHVVEHFGYHLGQILYVYKMRTGTDPKFYEL